MGPHPLPYYGTEADRLSVCRLLDVTTAGLMELQQMRQEAEKRVKGALRGAKEKEEMGRPKIYKKMPENEEELLWVRTNTFEVELKMRDMVIKDLEVIRNERTVRSKTVRLGEHQERMDQVNFKKPEPGAYREELEDLVTSDIFELGYDPKEKNTSKQEVKEKNKFVMDRVRERCNGLIPITQLSPVGTEPPRIHDINLSSYRRMGSREVQNTEWVRSRSAEQDQYAEDARCGKSKSNERNDILSTLERQPSLSTLLSELPALPRTGAGSLPPRFRLGSSGVTSDLLFTRRMTGSCISAPSSGFFESSDLDSISSSCSSLCSEASSCAQFSLKSNCSTSAARPWSTDFTAERRKELRSVRGSARRPMSAGALDTFLLPSPCHSKKDNITYMEEDRTLEYSPCSIPPHSVIQQRHRVERYICKLALKYRCRPGSSTLPTDHGPPTRRTSAATLIHSECPFSPPPPKCHSLSASVGDVRKAHRGSWGRFLSKVMLRKISRTAASEMNLEICGQRSQNTLRGSFLEENRLPRAKSFRDLLSVNLFKKKGGEA
ncbi:Hypothetical predicted protein [Pelobates cultripes]|uniref:Uncharacterized protein n=1 Tax=Pelobates cultripes TaxID=61616 RepID=A0AAD1TK16_PELCU|nr:Hypothetical predicted protein [Pelobates cultripes]CAH2325103.1 Hypothetical predicted protein [Pelobates cultripes]CAH2325104.1 Hypothetical predicted protein [Pelobates cultripes]CAH2325105.1 Hypothetical predicted protein [Pelobates cultripes]